MRVGVPVLLKEWPSIPGMASIPRNVVWHYGDPVADIGFSFSPLGTCKVRPF